MTAGLTAPAVSVPSRAGSEWQRALAAAGGVLAFALGLRSEGFPRNDGQMKTVIGISVVLTVIAITTAIIGGITGAGESKGLRHGPEAAKHSE